MSKNKLNHPHHPPGTGDLDKNGFILKNISLLHRKHSLWYCRQQGIGHNYFYLLASSLNPVLRRTRTHIHTHRYYSKLSCAGKRNQDSGGEGMKQKRLRVFRTSVSDRNCSSIDLLFITQCVAVEHWERRLPGKPLMSHDVNRCQNTVSYTIHKCSSDDAWQPLK